MPFKLQTHGSITRNIEIRKSKRKDLKWWGCKKEYPLCYCPYKKHKGREISDVRETTSMRKAYISENYRVVQ